MTERTDGDGREDADGDGEVPPHLRELARLFERAAVRANAGLDQLGAEVREWSEQLYVMALSGGLTGIDPRDDDTGMLAFEILDLVDMLALYRGRHWDAHDVENVVTELGRIKKLLTEPREAAPEP